ncbi:MAG: Ig-like domain-containing protein [Gemmatimonadetes bacterium]|nr:Ig-like domain-containing protein [Gemmatimonadota bacterium]
MRIRTGRWRTWLLAPLVLMGCEGLDDALTPGREASALPARVAMFASLPATSATTTVELGVVGRYLRTDGTTGRLLERTVALTNAAEQAVPLAVDLGACLADAQRRTGPDGKGCQVTLAVALMVDGATVDRQLIGPLLLQPGATAQVPEPVSLFEIDAVEVRGPLGLLPDGAALSSIVGSPVALRATIRDRAGVAVTGRVVSWSSDAPAVATVDSAGTVTALAAGTAQITATHGAVSRHVALRVARPPVEVVVRPGLGAGVGRIVSTPAGLDCVLGGGVGRGSCSALFAADSMVRLQASSESGSRFAAWGASCDGAAATCQLVVDAPRVVTAGFVALRRVAVVGDGDGRGSAVGGGLDCRIDGRDAQGTCTVTVAEGERLTVRAVAAVATTADAESRFAAWGGACRTAGSATCELDVAADDVTLRLGFHAPRVVSVQLDGDGSGRVDGHGVSCAGSAATLTGNCRVSVAHGTAITLRAVPVAGSRFVSWSGACAAAGDASTCDVIADRALSARAAFAAGRELVVEPGGGDGEGRVMGPGGLDCVVKGNAVAGTCRVMISADSAQLEAMVAGTPRRQTFGGWESGCAIPANHRCVARLADGRTVVRPRFHDEQRLVLSVGGKGAGQVTASAAALACTLAVGGRVSGVCAASEPWGTNVTLQAVADARSAFAGWSGECQPLTATTCTTRLVAARQVTATFVPRQVPLTLSGVGDGEGTLLVNGQPACVQVLGGASPTCDILVNVGAVVTVTVAPAASSVFQGFVGDCLATTCQLNVDAPRGVRSRIALRRFTLTTTPSGAGGGVTTVNGTAACTLVPGTSPAPCQMSIAWGTTLQLVNTPAVGSVLASLGGACVLGTPCTIRVTGDVQVAPRFEPGLRVELLPGGTGGGSLSALGLTCTLAGGVVSGSCVGYVLPGASLTIAAQPDANSQLQGWVGGCRATVGATCVTPILEPQRITARFAPVP